jgi:RHS repeat-associated protein
LYRLTSVNYNSGAQVDTYAYDAVGNRTRKNSTTSYYVYDPADQLQCTRSTSPDTCTGGVTSFGYDLNGNQTAKGNDSFQWDRENRLTSATVNSATTTYSYNGDGLRVARTSAGVTTYYTWDVAGGLPMLLQDGTNTFVYGDRLLYTATGTGTGPGNEGTPTWLFGDKLGSTATLMNAAGAITGSYQYDVFGAVRSQTGATTEFTFTGEQNDPNGLEYLRARYYDNSTGRFLSVDPAQAPFPYALVPLCPKLPP